VSKSPTRDRALSRTPDIFTIDVEDWFHILESDEAPPRERWGSLESRVERNTERLLALLEETGAEATCFVVGWVAERHPGLVRRIAAAGHEIASHSFWHEVVRRHTRASFAADAIASKRRLEDLSGRPVEGFRAAGNSITRADAWALEEIAKAGFRYDASLCPARSSHGGFPSPYTGPHLVRTPSGTLIEIPSATLGLGRFRLPYAGGGYLRLFPYPLLCAAIGLERARHRPTNLYVHPREIDVEQPRLALPRLRRFKYYVGLATTERKLRRLLSRGRYVSVRRWIAERRPDLLGKVLDLRALCAGAEPSPDPARVPPPPVVGEAA
jgi:polysaccharide deacetylase family protein (PEP-CTERM system associated)